MIIQKLQDIVEENKSLYSKGYLRNLSRSYLQLLVLDFIYNGKYACLIFKGGSCLRICFDLPRLSEDLDFDYAERFDTKGFFEEIAKFIHKEQGFPQLETRISKDRLYLKFPVLKSLGLATPSESDKLYVKIELSQAKRCKFKTELQPIFKEGFSFLIKRYDLSTLMAGKIEAVLQRVWFRGEKDEITIKGRDYFDLYWYLQKRVEPNYQCLFYKKKRLDKRQVWQKITERVKKVKPKDLEYDLVNLVKDQEFVRKFCKNYRTLFQEELKRYLQPNKI